MSRLPVGFTLVECGEGGVGGGLGGEWGGERREDLLGAFEELGGADSVGGGEVAGVLAVFLRGVAHG
jgi:hypothetical protein